MYQPQILSRPRPCWWGSDRLYTMGTKNKHGIILVDTNNLNQPLNSMLRVNDIGDCTKTFRYLSSDNCRVLPSVSDRTWRAIPFLSTKPVEIWPVPRSSHIRSSLSMYSFTRRRVLESVMVSSVSSSEFHSSEVSSISGESVFSSSWAAQHPANTDNRVSTVPQQIDRSVLQTHKILSSDAPTQRLLFYISK